MKPAYPNRFLFLAIFVLLNLLPLVSLTAQTTAYTTLFDNSTFPKSIDPSRPVGMTKGGANVSGDGSASYSIPIYCAPGTNKMLPSLALSYSSSGANGMMGQGWNIGGLSAITRTGWDIYHHGKVEAVAYENKAPYYSAGSAYMFEKCDAFVLDGQYLYPNAPAAGTYGKNGAQYTTENQSYSVITSYGAINGGPEYFRVTAKDGTVMEFGNTADSRVMSDDGSVVMFWRINKIQDINGNYISFVYDITDRDFRISQVKYTGNANTGLLPYNEIDFQYTIRDDKNTAYDHGFSQQSKYLLWQVQVKAEGTLYKTYQMNYGKSATGASFLKYVEEFAADGSRLNDTRFQYGAEVPMSAETETTGLLMGSAPTDNTLIVPGDFDGDGLSDILLTEIQPVSGDIQNTQITIKKRASLGSTTYNAIYSYAFSSGSTTLENTKFIRNSYASTVSDFNGDGRDDILLTKNNFTGGVRTIDWIKVYYAKPDGSFDLGGTADYTYGSSSFSPAVRVGSRGQQNYCLTGDFDGDGSTDFITIFSGELNFHSPRKNLVKTCTSLSGYTVDDLFTNADYAFVVSADGDAKSDLMLVIDNVTRIFTFNFEAELYDLHLDQVGPDKYYPTRYHDISLGDFNGDGRTDILTGPIKSLNMDTDTWVVGYFDGNYFQQQNLVFDHVVKQYARYNYNSPFAPDVTDDIRVGDYNGDGKTDIYLYQYNGTYTGTFKHHVYYSTGTQFQHEVLTTSDKGRNLTTGDYNGDGKTDVLFYSKDYTDIFHYFHPGEQSGLLQRVTDGFNRTSSFTYQPISWGTGSGAGDFYTKGSGETYPVSNMQVPMYVVTGFTEPDGIGGADITTYKYRNLLLHRAGRGMLGFEKVTAYNNVTDKRTENTMGLDRTYYIPYQATSATFLNTGNVPLSQVDNTVSIASLGSYLRAGGMYNFVLHNNSSIQRDYLLGLTTVTNNDFDTYGNVTNTSSVTSGGAETMSNTIASTYIATGTSAIPNRPLEITSTNQRGAHATAGNKQTFTYNSTGLAQNTRTVSTEASADYVDLHQDYDAYGNVVYAKKSTATSTAANEPVQAFEYDSKGRFVTSVTNAYNDKRYITTHPFWGQPVAQTGYNGLSNTYSYDSWGKLQSSVIATGPSFTYTITNSDGWDIGGNQLYYKLQQDPSAPDVKSWYDVAGRELKTTAETFGGAWTTALKTYDQRGNILTATNSYLPAETPITTTNTYDALNRISTSSNIFGTTNYAYDIVAGLNTTTTTLPDGKIKKITKDVLGKVLKSSNGIAGTVYYTYDSRGNDVKEEVGDEGSAHVKMVEKTYDGNGRLISMGDQDAGTTTYQYDQFGRMTSQTDANAKTTTWQYDIAGNPTQKVVDGYTTTYSYYGKDKDYRLQQVSVNSSVDGTVTDYYEYATGGGTTLHRKTLPTGLVEKSFTYDPYNRRQTAYYLNSGFQTRNQYDANGFLQQVSTDMPGTPVKVLYQVLGMNGQGKVTSYRRADGLNATATYTNTYLTNLNTPGIQDLEMAYNMSNGNMVYREDRVTHTTESFTYDAIDRLTKAEGSHVSWPYTVMHTPLEMSYDVRLGFSMGQLTAKSDVGTYGYGYRPANALINITPGASTVISHETQDITYTPFDKAHLITELIGGVPYEEHFIYDAGEDRAYSRQLQGGVLTRERVYMGDYEYEQRYTGGTGVVRQLHYISDENGFCGIVVKEGGIFHYYSAYTDHLGSIVTLTDESGTAIAHQSFDAWGRIRNPNTWDYDMTGAPVNPDWLYRGYTGHEMLPEYGLINMNGRMYDPANGRMLRPDNHIQDPYNSQNYNRYSYCLNNPLKYTDPSGEFWHIIAGAVIGGFVNIALHAQQIMSSGHAAQDLAVAFAIGAAGGAVAAATGGASLAAMGAVTGTSTVVGLAAAAGAASVTQYATSTPITATLNSIYFHDPLPTPKQYLKGMFVSGVIGVSIGGLQGAVQRLPLWQEVEVPKAPYNYGTTIESPQEAHTQYEVEHPEVGELKEAVIKPKAGMAINTERTQFEDNILSTTPRNGRDGDAVEVLFKNGNKMDINAARVKEWVPNLHPEAPPGTLQKVKFDDFLPGSKGYKRLPTQNEIDFLNSFFSK